MGMEWHPSLVAFEAVSTNQAVKALAMQGHKSPAWRKVTVPGISHRGNCGWAEMAQSLNISRIYAGG